ncbi:hypothetical protein CYMTET_4880 [Cymbomonas tetramitiformis]|uniref:Uncharacterized protein n=1 Tax=Cymbomonas tetramitiformis TaxID=36881 RepID=A0AAE0H0C2_9CHLO|nr:hypothetical protein CYMTET_4880 [Cymbomonas tetramitiformis]
MVDSWEIVVTWLRVLGEAVGEIVRRAVGELLKAVKMVGSVVEEVAVGEMVGGVVGEVLGEAVGEIVGGAVGEIVGEKVGE